MTTPSSETPAAVETVEDAKQRRLEALTELRKAHDAVLRTHAQLVLALSNVIRTVIEPSDPAALEKLASLTDTSPRVISKVLLGDYNAPGSNPKVIDDLVLRLLGVVPVNREDGYRVRELLATLRHLREVASEAETAMRTAARAVQKAEVQASLEEHEQRKHREQRKTDSPPCAVPDAAGHVYKPDPLAATTEQEFVQALRDLQVWGGNPGLREVSRRCGGTPTHSSFSKMLSASTVPKKFAPVHAFITGLGLEEDDVRRWMTAWRTFAMSAPGSALIPWYGTRAS